MSHGLAQIKKKQMNAGGLPSIIRFDGQLVQFVLFCLSELTVLFGFCLVLAALVAPKNKALHSA